MKKIKSLSILALLTVASLGLAACGAEKKKTEENTATIETNIGATNVVTQTPPEMGDIQSFEDMDTSLGDASEVEEKIIDEIESEDVQSSLADLEIELKNK